MKMRRTLYLKFLAAYLLFGCLSVIMVSTFTSNMILRRLTRDEASSLYREAQLIASNYAVQIYDNKDESKKAAVYQLKAIEHFVQI